MAGYFSAALALIKNALESAQHPTKIFFAKFIQSPIKLKMELFPDITLDFILCNYCAQT